MSICRSRTTSWPRGTAAAIAGLSSIDEGLLEPPFWFQFVLGVRGGSPPEVKQLRHMVEMAPPGAHWSVCGIGRAQLPLGMAAMAMGGHVRTGLEDNIWYRKGELAQSNAQLVARVALQARVADVDHVVARLQELRDGLRVRALALQAHVERGKRAMCEPGLERAGNRPRLRAPGARGRCQLVVP